MAGSSTALYGYSYINRPLTPPNDEEKNNNYIKPHHSDHSTPERSRKLPLIPISTYVLTPPYTPRRCSGPLLLPKIRMQDQALELAPIKVVSPPRSSEMSRVGYATILLDLKAQQPRVSLPPLSTGFVAVNDASHVIENPNQMPPNSAIAPFSSSTPQIPVTPSILFSTYPTIPLTTTLLSYLTSHNPSPSLVPDTTPKTRETNPTSCWWDIRNVRPWTSFSLSTLHSIPGFTNLLNLPIPAPALRIPRRMTSNPNIIEELIDGYTTFYGQKVNSALKVALGNPALSMLSSSSKPDHTIKSKHCIPEFTTNYAADHEPRIFHQPRARVVGVVLSFYVWNSGMRQQGGCRQMSYLRELARLQEMMRERGCRYGFIITEIELVCVRLGGPSAEEHAEIPVFGYVELTAPIPLALHHDTNSNDADSTAVNEKLTACLALWYLNMLSKSVPLPGQPSWKINVGGVAAVTRKKFLERDAWMVRPEGREKREAKRRRGWVWPGEGLSRRELGGGRMRRGKVS